MPSINAADFPQAIQQAPLEIRIGGGSDRPVLFVVAWSEFAFAATLRSIIVQDLVFQDLISPGGKTDLEVNLSIFGGDGCQGLLYDLLAIFSIPYPLLHKDMKTFSQTLK